MAQTQTPTTQPTTSQPPPVAKTYTNWDAFAKAGITLVALDCSAYKPVHLSDFSCHSHIMYTVEALKRHLDSGHGGAYQFYVRKTDSKQPLGLWAALETSGLESLDFRCAVCWEKLRFHPTSILPHLQPHRGNTKQAYKEAIVDKPGCLGKLSLTLTSRAPEITEDQDELRGDS